MRRMLSKEKKSDGCDNSSNCNDSLRELYLIGEINTESANRFIQDLRRLDSRKGPINIVIGSSGGEEGAGWAIYDALLLCQNATIGQAVGECQSMAALIIQGCSMRLLAKECRFMIHNGSIELDINVSALSSYYKEIERTTRRYREILATRSEQPLEEIERMCKEETFLSAEQALTLGLCDGILVKKPKGKTK